MMMDESVRQTRAKWEFNAMSQLWNLRAMKIPVLIWWDKYMDVLAQIAKQMEKANELVLPAFVFWQIANGSTMVKVKVKEGYVWVNVKNVATSSKKPKPLSQIPPILVQRHRTEITCWPCVIFIQAQFLSMRWTHSQEPVSTQYHQSMHF